MFIDRDRIIITFSRALLHHPSPRVALDSGFFPLGPLQRHTTPPPPDPAIATSHHHPTTRNGARDVSQAPVATTHHTTSRQQQTGARDATRLEPLVSFFFVIFISNLLITI
jgi:hypothetical protein